MLRLHLWVISLNDHFLNTLLPSFFPSCLNDNNLTYHSRVPHSPVSTFLSTHLLFLLSSLGIIPNHQSKEFFCFQFLPNSLLTCSQSLPQGQSRHGDLSAICTWTFWGLNSAKLNYLTILSFSFDIDPPWTNPLPPVSTNLFTHVIPSPTTLQKLLFENSFSHWQV